MDKRRKILLLVTGLVLLFSDISAQQYNIRNSCQSGEENLFSMANRSGGHAAEPGVYPLQVCANGIEDSSFSEKCSGELDSILALLQKNNSHVSTFDAYKWKVCATVSAEINNSCAQDDRIVSLAKEDNSHVAAPGVFPKTLCSSGRKVENISLEMKVDADEVFVDGETAEEKTYSPEEVSYPYIVTDQPAGIVSYGDLESIKYDKNGSTDVMRVTQETGSFLVPNTEGGYTQIEDREILVGNRQLANRVDGSFAFTIPEENRVKVIYDTSANLIGFERNLRNNIDLLIRNRVDGNSRPDIILEPD